MADDNTSSFNANETKIITAIMQNLTAEIQFDVDKVAAELGYKDAGSFRARWNSIKRSKITGAAAGSPGGGVSKSTPGRKSKGTPKSTPRSGQKKAKAKVTDDDDSENGDGSPKAKGKKGRKAKGDVKVKAEEDEEPQDVAESVEGAGEVAAAGDQEDGGEDGESVE